MNKLIDLLKSNTATAGVIRTVVAFGAGWFCAKGFKIPADVSIEQLTGLIMALATLASSIASKKSGVKQR